MREMKDSGCFYLGKIPNNWLSSKFKYVKDMSHPYPIGDGDHGSIKPSMYIDSGIPYIRVQNIDWGKELLMDDVVYISNETNNANKKSILRPGDLIVAKTGGTIGKTAIIPSSIPMANTTSSVGKISISKNNCNKYYFYVLSSKVCSDQMWDKAKQKSAQPGFNIEDIEVFKIPFPPYNEQKRIADFLDKKCFEIDNLTSDIEKQIEILDDYKKSVIFKAVTKGLNPNVKMKNSGIDYVGLIPSSWEIHPVYYYFFEGKNRNVFLKEQNLLSLSYGKIKRKDINTSEGLLPESFNTYNIVEKNDIIIRPTDLQNDKRSLRTGLVMERGIITSAYLDLKPRKKINSIFFHYLLHIFDAEKVFYNMGNGVRQGLNYDEFSRLLVFCPTLDEQNLIVDYLNAKCSMIDSLISDKRVQLDILAEYKKSLIYEYVTGKKEVI